MRRFRDICELASYCRPWDLHSFLIMRHDLSIQCGSIYVDHLRRHHAIDYSHSQHFRVVLKCYIPHFLERAVDNAWLATIEKVIGTTQHDREVVSLIAISVFLVISSKYLFATCERLHSHIVLIRGRNCPGGLWTWSPPSPSFEIEIVVLGKAFCSSEFNEMAYGCIG